MAYRRAFLCAALLLAGGACSTSGDGGGESDGGMDAGDDGPRRPRPGRNDSGVSNGDPMRGDSGAGGPCETVADCQSDLACVQSDRFLFCAEPCERDDDCGRGICHSYTGRAADAHCVGLEREEYGPCGEAYVALCGLERVCLTFPDQPVGICVDICELDGTADTDGGVDDDAGAADMAPDGGSPYAICRDEQSCAPDVLANEALGVCGTLVERGGECGIDVGLFCEQGDICTREDPSDFDEVPLCRQDCTARDATCDEGTCTDIRNRYAVCL